MSRIDVPWRDGDVLAATLDDGRSVYGRFLGHDDAVGTVIIVYDSAGMPPNDLTQIVNAEILIRASPVHFELVGDGTWTSIGHVPLTRADTALLPDTLGIISGVHCQLLAANHHYGLAPNVNTRQLDDYLNIDGHPIPATLYYRMHPFPKDVERLLKRHKDNVYFLDEIWCDAEDWANGERLDEARSILIRGPNNAG
ncbi:MAG: Imm26 family immunity protein [Planctomycetaceae bacterium]